MNRRSVLFIYSALCIAGMPCRSVESGETVHVESVMAQSEELEKKLCAGTRLVNDSVALQYVAAVVRRLTLPEDRKNIRIHIMKDPSFNAFASPHGAIYLCSGILGRMENEAELAAIIGHEMTHITNDHAVLSLTRAKQKAHTSTIAMIGLDFFIGGFGGAIANTVFKAAITGYSRDLERQADSMGLVRMRHAGYSPLAFLNMFIKLRTYIVDEKIREPFFFSTHPNIEERIRNYYAIAGSDTVLADKGTIGREEFLATLGPQLLLAARTNFARGHYASAQRVAMNVLSVDSCSAPAFSLLGDIARFHRDTVSTKDPIGWYSRALSCAPENGPALKNAGIFLFARGEKAKAREYLKRYVSAAGRINDRELIETYIRLCENE